MMLGYGNPGMNECLLTPAEEAVGLTSCFEGGQFVHYKNFESKIQLNSKLQSKLQFYKIRSSKKNNI